MAKKVTVSYNTPERFAMHSGTSSAMRFKRNHANEIRIAGYEIFNIKRMLLSRFAQV
jgi:hypothetical protein